MTINWDAVVAIAAPILALFAGVWINRKFESRPILTSYFGHISSFKTKPPDREPIFVNTHAVVLRNTGRRSATNVRIHHLYLPDFNIWPAVQFQTESLPDGSRDIVIPVLVPGEEVTISYLYFPPLTASGINAGIKSDHGFANQIAVMLQRRYPVWLARTFGVLTIVGAIAIVYLLYFAVQGILHAA